MHPTCTREIWDAAQEQVTVDETTFRAAPPLPRCRHCRALARPNILMFGDGSWLEHRSGAQREKLTDWLAALVKKSAQLAVIEIGAGTGIPTVRQTSETIAIETSGTLIRINPREPRVPSGHISLPYGGAEGLKKILHPANQTRSPQEID